MRTAAGRLLSALLLAFLATPAFADTQTLVFMRHGEKPSAGLGQLDCQGLNRALALPAVLRKRFGAPAAIFAPNPADKMEENDTAYAYVRPLATIEPTAIAFGLPVNVDFAFGDIKGLQGALAQPALQNGVVFIAWEHKQIAKLAGRILADNGGDAGQVDKWKGDDFDSLYVIRIKREGGTVSATYQHSREGLDGQSINCPSMP
jgi:hypothetical protein